jgi:uncharacterized protein YjbI with pentapeptide repeats
MEKTRIFTSGQIRDIIQSLPSDKKNLLSLENKKKSHLIILYYHSQLYPDQKTKGLGYSTYQLEKSANPDKNKPELASLALDLEFRSDGSAYTTYRDLHSQGLVKFSEIKEQRKGLNKYVKLTARGKIQACKYLSEYLDDAPRSKQTGSTYFGSMNNYTDNLIERLENDPNLKTFVELEFSGIEGFSTIENKIVSWLKTGKKPLFLILGDKGTGKTTYIRKLAHTFSRKTSSETMTFIIDLKDFKPVESIDQLFERFCKREGINVSDFLSLMQTKKALVILDNLDQISADPAEQTLLNDMAKISQIFGFKCKVIVAARTNYFTQKDDPERIFSSYLQEKVIVNGFNEDSIKKYLQLIVGSKSENCWFKIKSKTSLFELAKRPFVLALMNEFGFLKRLCDEKDDISEGSICELILDQWLRQEGWRGVRPESSLIIMEHLALQDFLGQKILAGTPEIIQTTKNHSPTQNSEPSVLNDIVLKLLKAGILTLNEKKSISLTNRIFGDFLTAKKLCDDIQKGQVESFQKRPLTKGILDFLSEMLLDKKSILWKMLLETRGKSFEETSYLGGNTLSLIQLMGESLKNRNFEDTIFIGAKLENADFEGSNLSEANLNMADLKNAKFIGGVLYETQFEGANLESADFSNAVISGAYFGEPDNISELVPNASFNLMAAALGNTVVVSKTFGHDKKIRILKNNQTVANVFWNPYNETELATIDSQGTIKKWSLENANYTDLYETFSPISYACFFDNESILVILEKNEILIWNTRQDEKYRWQIPKEIAEYFSVVDYAPGEKDSKSGRLAIGCTDGKVSIWHVDKQKKEFTEDLNIRVSDAVIRKLKFTEKELFIVENSSKIFTLKNGAKRTSSIIEEIIPNREPDSLFFFDTHGRYLAIAKQDSIEILNVNTRNFLQLNIPNIETPANVVKEKVPSNLFFCNDRIIVANPQGLLLSFKLDSNSLIFEDLLAAPTNCMKMNIDNVEGADETLILKLLKMNSNIPKALLLKPEINRLKLRKNPYSGRNIVTCIKCKTPHFLDEFIGSRCSICGSMILNDFDFYLSN